MTAAHKGLAYPFGTLPAIRIDDAAHPLVDRRQVSLRWLGATGVLACVSGGALWLVLHGMLARTALPARPEPEPLAAAERTNVSGARSDRLVFRSSAPPSHASSVHLTTLRSTGLGGKPLTMLVADLARIDAQPRPQPEGGAPSAALTKERAAVTTPPQPLPAIITSGLRDDGGRLPTLAASYAAAERPPAIEPGPRGTPLNVTTIGREPAPQPDRVDLAIGQRGDTIDQVLARFSFALHDLADLAAALSGGAAPLLTGGERFEIHRAGGSPTQKPYLVLFRRSDGSSTAAALTDADRYARIEPEQGADASDQPSREAAADLEDDELDAPTSGSLRQAVSELDGHEGVDEALAASIARVLGAGADLGRGVAADDRLQALYSPPDENGQREVLFAALEHRGKTTRFYRYAAPDDGSSDYYDEAGHSIMKFLLRKPVANGQLGDGFGWRIHPVLHDRRFHEGVDYRAPFGSPIVAAGAGVVEKIGWEKGYGLYLRVRHDLGYETTYAHLSAIGRGMAVGQRVQQGETIAYVGSTGYSTGPHLYYEVRINGRNVDPLSVRLAAGRFLQGAVLSDFARRRERIDTLVKASLDDPKP